MAVIQTASQTASRQRAWTRIRSVERSVSGNPQAWMAWMCASRVRVWVLKANIDPASIPAARSPVHSNASAYPAQAVSANPRSRTILNTRTGDTPSHCNGAPINAGTISGSEKASESCSG